MDELISIIVNKKNKTVNNFKKNNSPKIFIIGEGKSGTTSLTYGFENEIVAHWHTKRFLCSRYKINDTLIQKLKNYDLYDIILHIGKKYKFKPLIIETIREPISRKISKLFHHYVSNSDIKTVQKFVIDKINDYNNNIDETNIKITCDSWDKKFNINLCKLFEIEKGYFYTELENIKLLFLKYEIINDFEKIISDLGFKFKLINDNITIKKEKFNSDMKNIYIKLKNGELIEIKYDILQKIYDDSYVKYFYSKKEINTFKIKYGYKI